MCDSVRHHALHPRPTCHLHKGIVAVVIVGFAVIPEFDQYPVTTEMLDQCTHLGHGRARAVAHQRHRHHPSAVTGEHPSAVSNLVSNRGQVVSWCAFCPCELSVRHRTGHPPVPLVPLGDHHHSTGMHPGRGNPCELHSQHGWQAMCASGLGESDHAVETIAVGESKRVEAQTRGLGG